MGRLRRAAPAALALLLVAAQGDLRAQPPAGDSQRVRFVQWTDPHVFDARVVRKDGPGVGEAVDNRVAVWWAVAETNQQDAISRLDFVALTGDFGVENVSVPGMDDCVRTPAGDAVPFPVVPLAAAVAETRHILSLLNVDRVFVVPGNNDLCNEDPGDLKRWTAFVDAVKQGLSRPAVIDLTAESATVNGVVLVGLNSAFFKSRKPDASASEEEKKAAAATRKRLASDADSAISGLLSRLRQGVAHLLFTHIPDAKDPYKKTAAWDEEILKVARPAWEAKIASPDVLGVFAGHFHAPERDIYPRALSLLEPGAAIHAKLWVAPPLAAKFQPDAAKTARGLLLVDVRGKTGAVTATPLWFAVVDQAGVAAGDDKLAQARLFERRDQWDEAAKKYQEVLSLTTLDPRTRATALAGYAAADEQMRRWWWRSPLSRWVYLHWLAWAHTAWVALVLIALAAVGYTAVRFLGRLAHLLWLFKRLVIPRFRGAVVNATNAANTTAPTAEFTAALFAASEGMHEQLLRERENWAARHINLLMPAVGSFDTLTSSMPAVTAAGVDVTSWVKFLMQYARAFRWTLDTTLTVWPPVGAEASPTADVPVGGRAGVHAVLRWGWTIKRRWYREVPITDRSSLRDLAREVVELTAGEALARNPVVTSRKARRFTEAESFRLFMEGLRALYLYEEAESKGDGPPVRTTLETHLQAARDSFHGCVSQYVEDPLPRYYHATVLGLAAQIELVRRLEAESVRARQLGPRFPFRPGISAATLLRVRGASEDLYAEATAEFGQTARWAGPGDVGSYALYNQAQVLAKSESRPLQREAVKVLAELPDNVWVRPGLWPWRRFGEWQLAGYLFQERARQGHDDVDRLVQPIARIPGVRMAVADIREWAALLVQTRLLSSFLACRLKHGGNPARVADPETDLEWWLVAEHARRSIRADYFNKRGFLFWRRWVDSGHNDDLVGAEDAVRRATEAVGRPWGPALVTQIRVFMARADLDHADQMLQRVLGASAPAVPAPVPAPPVDQIVSIVRKSAPANDPHAIAAVVLSLYGPQPVDVRARVADALAGGIAPDLLAEILDDLR